MPKINFTRTEVGGLVPKWDRIRACIGGEEAIKKLGDKILPRPNPSDVTQENRDRYDGYLKRAVFYNVLDNTLRGLVGQVFAADPVVELPDNMKVMEADVDGNGVTLIQQSKAANTDTLAFGRCGLLMDFPEGKADGSAFTAAEVMNGEARPTIQLFDPAAIINWRTSWVNGRSLLTLVVLSSQYVAVDDGFELKYDDEWRVLRLVDRVYTVEVWRKREKSGGAVPNSSDPTDSETDFYIHRTFEPTDYSGKPLDFIPFTFIGSLNNNELPDKPPMYDLAEINIAHYRNSADYEDSVYMVGQPTPVVTGLTVQWVKDVFKDKPIQLGSRGIVGLPAGATAAMLVASENGMVKEAMESKERQMVALGAQLVEQKEVQRTLGEAQMERAVVNSTLVQCAKNTAAAYTKALQWASLFYGPMNLTIEYQLSTDFSIVRMTPEERSAWVADLQAGVVSWTEARYAYRQSGLAYQDDKEAKAEIEKDQAEAVDLDAEDPAGDPPNPDDE